VPGLPSDSTCCEHEFCDLPCYCPATGSAYCAAQARRAEKFQQLHSSLQQVEEESEYVEFIKDNKKWVTLPVISSRGYSDNEGLGKGKHSEVKGQLVLVL